MFQLYIMTYVLPTHVGIEFDHCPDGRQMAVLDPINVVPIGQLNCTSELKRSPIPVATVTLTNDDLSFKSGQ